MSLEERVKQSSRRGSAVAIVSNPLEVDSAGGLTSPLKLVKLSDSRAVTAPELKTICDRLQSLGYVFVVIVNNIFKICLHFIVIVITHRLC
jgi:hypothetical protein